MQYSNFDTNLLRALDALLTERSVTRAAERICLSQPAMSGALGRLRDHFQDPLLIRAGRDMVLTPLAETLAGPVRDTLLKIELTLSTRPSFDPKTTERTFRLAMSDYGAFVFAPLLRRFTTDAPALACHVELIGSDTLGRIENGDLDLFIAAESCEVAARYPGARDLKRRILHLDDFVCLIDPEHAPASLTIADYLEQPHALVRFGHGLDTLVEQAWKRAHLAPRVMATAPSFSAMAYMIPGTAMIGTVQRRFARFLAEPLRLKIVECPFDVGSLQQIMLWHPRSDLDPAHRYLRQAVVEVAGLAERDAESSVPGGKLRPRPRVIPGERVHGLQPRARTNRRRPVR